MNREDSPVRPSRDSSVPSPKSAKSILRFKRPSVRISNVNEPPAYRPDWRNLVVFNVSHAPTGQSHTFSIEANVTTFVWQTLEIVCQEFGLDSQGYVSSSSAKHMALIFYPSPVTYSRFSARLYKETAESSQGGNSGMPVLKECKMEDTMTDLETSEGDKFEIVLREDDAVV